jgi:2-phospho-L-lactate transferase/gluconeogenesis factor (CofD/UPF0052 family)
MHRGVLVVLSGGSGTRTFSSHLARRLAPVTFLVNAYDDGKSTGRIRQSLGILGPSDPAKLVGALAADGSVPAVARLFDLRLPVQGSTAELRDRLRYLVERTELPHGVQSAFDMAVEAFITATETTMGTPAAFDYRNLAVRNAILVGVARRLGGYGPALDYLVELLGLPARIVLASEKTAHLVGVLEDGRVLASEAEICAGPPRPRLRRVHLLRSRPSPEEATRLSHPGHPELTSHVIEREWALAPSPDERAIAALRDARGVVYAPGTLYSSLIPTALVLARELTAVEGPHVLVANLVQEDERMTVAMTVDAIRDALAQASPDRLSSQAKVEHAVTHVLVEAFHRRPRSLQRGEPMPLDRRRLQRMLHVVERPIEDRGRAGLHASAAIVDALEEIVR